MQYVQQKLAIRHICPIKDIIPILQYLQKRGIFKEKK